VIESEAHESNGPNFTFRKETETWAREQRHRVSCVTIPDYHSKSCRMEHGITYIFLTIDVA
jgi:hypothetical protein